MKKDNYIKSINQLQISNDFKDRTAQKMKEARKEKERKIMPKKLVLTFASAAIIVTTSAIALNTNLLSPHNTVNKNQKNETEISILSKTQGVTIPKVELKEPTKGKKEIAADMLGLFVYKGRIYVQSNTSLVTKKDFTIDKNVMLKLRGKYLGTTKGTINEWSNQKDYAKEFASTIGKAKVYTVKGYDSKYRLMVYTEYKGGFGCEIYDSFGGLTMTTGADYFNKIKLVGNISSYKWESYNSWNNGKGLQTKAKIADSFSSFIDALYTSEPVGENPDYFTEMTAYDSQKFVYVRTKDNLITSLRLFKDGYVYIQGVGFFKMDQDVFDAFYDSMPVTNTTTETDTKSDTPTIDASNVNVTIKKTSYPVGTKSITLNIKNNGNEEYFYGMDFSIEKQKGSSWEVVPAVKELAFIEIAKILEAKSSQEFIIDLSLLKPSLDEGIYRIVKKINNFDYNVTFELTK